LISSSLHENYRDTQKKNIDGGTIDMRGKYEETMEYIGKHSPVSIAG